uniref:SpoU_methylase domain-containing protein n=1 Tax=Parastrongyloides trichosuri TaxID=131310 RepID=A0A0N4ZV07_PARTI
MNSEIPSKKPKLIKDLSLNDEFYNQRFIEIIKNQSPEIIFDEKINFNEVIEKQNFQLFPGIFESYFENFVISIKNDQRINDEFITSFFLKCYQSNNGAKKLKMEALRALKNLTKTFCSSSTQKWSEYCKLMETLFEDQQHLLEHIIDGFFYFINNWRNPKLEDENMIFPIDYNCIIVLLSTAINKSNGWFKHAVICSIFTELDNIDIWENIEFYTNIVKPVFEDHNLIWRCGNEEEYRDFIVKAKNNFHNTLVKLSNEGNLSLVKEIIETMMRMFTKPSPYSFYNFSQLFDINIDNFDIKICTKTIEGLLKVGNNLSVGPLKKHAFYIFYKLFAKQMLKNESYLMKYISFIVNYSVTMFTENEIYTLLIEPYLTESYSETSLTNEYNNIISTIDIKKRLHVYKILVYLYKIFNFNTETLIIPEEFIPPKNDPFSLDICIRGMHYDKETTGKELINHYRYESSIDKKHNINFWNLLPNIVDELIKNALGRRHSSDFVYCNIGLINFLEDILKDDKDKNYYFKFMDKPIEEYYKLISEEFFKFYSTFKHVIFTNSRLGSILTKKIKETPRLVTGIEDLSKYMKRETKIEKKKMDNKFTLKDNLYSELLDMYLYPYPTKNDFIAMRIISEYSIKELEKYNLICNKKYDTVMYLHLTPLSTRAEMLALFNTFEKEKLSKLYGAIREEFKSFETNNTSFPFSDNHYRFSRLLQLIIVIVNLFSIEERKTLLPDIYNIFYSKVHQSSVRIYGEIIVSRMFFNNPQLLNIKEYAQIMANGYQIRPGSVVCFINILHIFVKGYFNNNKIDIEEEFFKNIIKAISPWITNNNFAVKNSAIHTLKYIKSVISQYPQYENSYVNSFLSLFIDGNLLNNGNGTKILQQMEEDFYYGEFNIAKHDSLYTYFVVFPENLGFNEEESHRNLVKFWDDIFLNYISIPLKNDDMKLINRFSILNGFSYPTYKIKINKLTSFVVDNEIEAPSQRKIAVPKLLPEKINTSQSIYVIASLVDKPENLGGICRTCESFRIDKLLIDSISVVKTKNFTALSMNADEWQDIEELKKDDILSYIKKQKKDGFKIIALEQTTKSTMISDFKFNPKTIIILGDEKLGVPVDILKICDNVIEIKQYVTCGLKFAMLFNRNFKNFNISYVSNNCELISEDEFTSEENSPLTTECETYGNIFFMSEELIDGNIKHEIIFVMIKDDKLKKFFSYTTYEQESNIYHVPSSYFTKTTKGYIFLNIINCRTSEIVMYFLSKNFDKFKNAYFVHYTVSEEVPKRIIMNIDISLPGDIQSGKYYKVMKYSLVFDIEKFKFEENESMVEEVCKPEIFEQHLSFILLSTENYEIEVERHILQLIHRNDHIITISKVINSESNDVSGVIELTYYDTRMNPKTVCLGLIVNINRPAFISFYDNRVNIGKKFNVVKQNDPIKASILYMVVGLIMIFIIILSCIYIKREYDEILHLDKEIKEMRKPKKKHKNFHEIINEKLQKQDYNNDNGKLPIIPYAIFDPRYNEKKKARAKRISGMEMKTYSKELELISD